MTACLLALDVYLWYGKQTDDTSHWSQCSSLKPGFHSNAANHGCHCFGRALLLAGACVCCSVEAVATMIGCLPTQAIAFELKPGLTHVDGSNRLVLFPRNSRCTVHCTSQLILSACYSRRPQSRQYSDHCSSACDSVCLSVYLSTRSIIMINDIIGVILDPWRNIALK